VMQGDDVQSLTLLHADEDVGFVYDY